LKPGRNCWRVERAGRASLIVDAADYYRHALAAMLAAKSEIVLIGWDVDTRVSLSDEPAPEGAPTTLGPLLTWLSKNRPGLNIRILAWDEGLLSVPGRGTTPFRLLRWAADPNVSIKWDGSHPLDASHHQKILVIDDALAFCGGIDITADRWDTRHHRDEEPGRRRPFTRRSYEPWHDATMAVDGAAAKALGDLARLRWKIATGDDLSVPPPATHDPWPDALEPDFRDVPVGIARTRGKDGEITEVREVEALFADMIAAARQLVYVETQYFASRAVAEAIARRLAEPLSPEFVIVNPRTAEGWLDEAVMGPARARLVETLRQRDPRARFRIYTPVTEGGLHIYVHAKVLIVDDFAFRVGSANLNNRSMGLDSECDLMIDGAGDAAAGRRIEQLRADLIAEHFGAEPEQVGAMIRESGSLIATIERLREEGGRCLCPFEPPEPSPAQAKLAESEALDPEAADELFERRARPGLLSGFVSG
jgi:phospholipase D1/2